MNTLSDADKNKNRQIMDEKKRFLRRQRIREGKITSAYVPANSNPNKRKKKKIVKPQGESFLLSYEWRVTRMKVLVRDGARCACCGSTAKDGVRMNVDHIKPRKTHPELALNMSNLQVLCEVCNHGKSNWDTTDWRKQHLSFIKEK